MANTNEMSMSDLLPLVAVALKDKAAADASEELSAAIEARDMAQRVEIIRAIGNGDGEEKDGEIVTYASALFETGHYLCENLWAVDLKQSGDNTCRLADLRDCHVCVGGGFPVACLDDNLGSNSFSGEINNSHRLFEEETSGDTVEVLFNFPPHTIWLTVFIHGWPREEWEAADIDPYEIVEYLVDRVAVGYPDATVEFREVSFVIRTIRGALKRLLPPKRKMEVLARRDEMIMAQSEWNRVREFVRDTMEERGLLINDDADPQTVLDFLESIGVKKRSDTVDEFISTVISAFEINRLDELRQLFQATRQREQGEEAEPGGTDEVMDTD